MYYKTKKGGRKDKRHELDEDRETRTASGRGHENETLRGREIGRSEDDGEKMLQEERETARLDGRRKEGEHATRKGGGRGEGRQEGRGDGEARKRE